MFLLKRLTLGEYQVKFKGYLQSAVWAGGVSVNRIGSVVSWLKKFCQLMLSFSYRYRAKAGSSNTPWKGVSFVNDAHKVYVGNLPWSVTDAQLSELFTQAGQVVSARVIIDKFRNRSKGFGFVEFSSDEDMNKAIEMFDGYEMEGRPLKVNQAQPPKQDYGPGR